MSFLHIGELESIPGLEWTTLVQASHGNSRTFRLLRKLLRRETMIVWCCFTIVMVSPRVGNSIRLRLVLYETNKDSVRIVSPLICDSDGQISFFSNKTCKCGGRTRENPDFLH